MRISYKKIILPALVTSVFGTLIYLFFLRKKPISLKKEVTPTQPETEIPSTKISLNDSYPLHKGKRHPDIKIIQKWINIQLGEMGRPGITIDGNWGIQTQNAILNNTITGVDAYMEVEEVEKLKKALKLTGFDVEKFLQTN